jgi:predicted transcriptional regulator
MLSKGYGGDDMTEENAIKLFKCLADKSRLQILKSLTLEDMYVERLAERLNLTPATISFHLRKLSEIDAVTSYKTQYYTMYSLCQDTFAVKILDILREQSDEADLQAKREQAYRQKVIDAFFEYGKLKSIPAQRKKERIVLEEIAKAFDPGRIYTEREVNIIIADYNDDFCTIRRDMISEKLMERDERGYWRTEVLPKC